MPIPATAKHPEVKEEPLAEGEGLEVRPSKTKPLHALSARASAGGAAQLRAKAAAAPSPAAAAAAAARSSADPFSVGSDTPSASPERHTAAEQDSPRAHGRHAAALAAAGARGGAGAAAPAPQQQLAVAAPAASDMALADSNNRLASALEILGERLDDMKEQIGNYRQAQDELHDTVKQQAAKIDALEQQMQQRPQQPAADASQLLATLLAMCGNGGPGRKGGGAKRGAAAAAAGGGPAAKKRAGTGSGGGGAGTSAAAVAAPAAPPPPPGPLIVERADGSTAIWPTGVSNAELQELLREFKEAPSGQLGAARVHASERFRREPLAVPHRLTAGRLSFIGKGELLKEARKRQLPLEQ